MTSNASLYYHLDDTQFLLYIILQEIKQTTNQSQKILWFLHITYL